MCYEEGCAGRGWRGEKEREEGEGGGEKEEGEGGRREATREWLKECDRWVHITLSRVL